jgi:dimeric dUTPase (all-alpha-NTP-PPase superfamily)
MKINVTIMTEYDIRNSFQPSCVQYSESSFGIYSPIKEELVGETNQQQEFRLYMTKDQMVTLYNDIGKTLGISDTDINKADSSR